MTDFVWTPDFTKSTKRRNHRRVNTGIIISQSRNHCSTKPAALERNHDCFSVDLSRVYICISCAHFNLLPTGEITIIARRVNKASSITRWILSFIARRALIKKVFYVWRCVLNKAIPYALNESEADALLWLKNFLVQ